MSRLLAAIALGLLVIAGSANAQQCPAFPVTLTNGSTANANDVMSNFNTIRNCPALATNPTFTGNVGIGTTTPWLTFVVQSVNGAIGLNGTGPNSAGQVAFYDTGTLVWKLFAWHPNGNFYLQNNGSSTNMTVVSGTNSWAAASDVRLKQNIRTLPVLDRLGDYRAVSFDWKASGKHDIGVVAQELYKVFPEVVNKGSEGDLTGPTDKGRWSVQYDRLGFLALEAAKELKVQNDKLQASNDELRAANQAQAQELAGLEARMARLETLVKPRITTAAARQ